MVEHKPRRRSGCGTHVGLVVGAAAITAVCAQVSFGYPVPTTLQTFAVLGAGALLGARRGVASQLLYLGAGATGMPVFADGHGGIDWLTRRRPAARDRRIPVGAAASRRSSPG